MAAVDFNAKISHLSNLLRQGQASDVRTELSGIKRAQIPRANAADVADLARRAGLPELSLLIMQPIVRDPKEIQQPASPRELSVYAAALARIGASREALEILQKIDTSTFPEALLHLSFAHIYRWEYSSAASCLSKYLRTNDRGDYSSQVAKLNLAACYRFLNQHEKEHALVEEIITVSRTNSWTLLTQNALELNAQRAIAIKNWVEADTLLKEAAQLATVTKAGEFNISKWRTIVQLQHHGPTVEILSELEKVRNEARRIGAWEGVRECDYYQALTQRDVALGLKVYFGTPFAGYLRRLKQEASTWLEIPANYVWQMSNIPSERILDLRATNNDPIGQEAKPEGILLHLMRIFASDFYRPIQLGDLFAQLYPDQYFNPIHSPRRVESNINRARAWMKENNIPLSIVCTAKCYHFQTPHPFAIMLSRHAQGSRKQNSVTSSEAESLAQLKSVYPYKTFTTQSAIEVLKISEKSARKLLQQAIKQRRVLRLGQGRATLFRFIK